MNIVALAAHITADPDSRGYDGKDDAWVTTDLAVLRWPGETRVTYLSLANQLDSEIVRNLIKSVEAAALADPLVDKIKIRLEQDESGGVDVGHATTRAMLDAFAANPLLDLKVDDAAAIKALADNKMSDAEKHGFGRVRKSHVRWAREQ